MTRLALHWQILIGMVAGVAFGLVASSLGWDKFVGDWVSPFGKIFVNSLKLIAVPLIITSLIKGVADLKDISKFSQMGGRTVILYLLTTIVAVTIGLLIANVFQPGNGFTEESRTALMGDADTQERAQTAQAGAEAQKDKGPLQALVDLVPSNIFYAATDNSNMLQVIFFTIFFGVGLLLVNPKQAQPVKDFFYGLNEVIMKLIDLIMLVAPIGVFALLAAQVVLTPSWDVLLALVKYSVCVLAGLSIMVFVFYPMLVRVFTGRKYGFFFRGIAPAQLLAFSTSSSAATLPVTMERVEEHLGVEREVSSVVLPVGATVNMDGTSLYQAVAAVFIAQAYGMGLDLAGQLNIVLTATLASIGSAAVPGAGMVMLVIVLGAIGVPIEGLALIVAMDRILDMCRTTVNVTGDATVAMLVAKSVGRLGDPHVKEWDDNYPPDDIEAAIEPELAASETE
ncbi:MAG: dicarboxylate/amino acid:cation symporter [Pirellulaceae bacterium]